MLQEEGNITVINPMDEIPHLDIDDDKEVHFQHGDTKIDKNDISVAFVFRVSQHTCLCKISDNCVVLPPELLEVIKEKEKTARVKQSDRMAKYDKFDKDSYHVMLKNHFKSILNE